MDEPVHTNRLIHEKSPYLLQHAHNPVNWHPWGEEAFRLAREQNKPVLVSIGYATCHWCHVMERESFEDSGLAKVLNENFVAIKVDREERPDVDAIYMQALQTLGQQGGWPLNVFVTPEGVPFYGGTYCPPAPRFNLPSFADILHRLSEVWKNDREKIARQNESLIAQLRQSSARQAAGSPDTLGFDGEDRAAKLFREYYDPLNHGFKFQPRNKFPPSMGLSLLLRHHHRTGDGTSLDMTENTLKAMKNGGIYDQIGGGLSRYSTDYRWLAPHFEKMLYDNALFVNALIETYQVTGKPEYADHANDVLRYIDRDMTSPEGGFYSAEDADSEGVEGKFYVWSQEEIERLLEPRTAQIALRYYNVAPGGNWEGHNIPHVTRTPVELAREMNLPPSRVEEALGEARRVLLEARGKRVRPLLDDKCLTSWNGLMIAAMAKTSRILEDPGRAEQAEKAAEFVFHHLRAPDGKLLRRYRDGNARYDGYLFDYTSLAVACLELYETTGKAAHLHTARDLMNEVEERFVSPCGAYYETDCGGEQLIVRQISGYDGVEPSGNSHAALAWLKLAAYFADPSLEARAEKIFSVFHDELMEYGINSAFMMQAFHLYLGGLKEVAVIAPRNHPSSGKMRALIRGGFFPHAVFAFAWEDEVENRDIPLLAGRQTVNGQATAWVCKRGTCLPPANDPEELKRLLNYED